jgi:hypothetical protein
MDSSTSGAIGIISLLFSGAGLVYAAVNHKRIRFKCCGRDIDVSIDVESTEPAAAAAAAAAAAPGQTQEPEPEPELEPEPEPEPIVVVPVRPKGRRNSLPPIIKKPRSRQIMPTYEEEE